MVKGVNATKRKLAIAERMALREAPKIVQKSARKGERKARRLAPEDTGRLKASINARVAGDGLSYTLGSDLDYAFWTNFGRTAKEPWLWKAFKTERKYSQRRARRFMRGLAKRLKVHA